MDWADLTAVMAARGHRYTQLRNRFTQQRPDLVETIAAKGLRLHGGRLPASWTRDDLRTEAWMSLVKLLDALRLHGTDLITGWGRIALSADDLAGLLTQLPEPRLDPQRLGPGNVPKYLVQWAAPVTRQALEDAVADVTAHRRALKLYKAISELSELRGVDPTPARAAAWSNDRRAETYGVAEATRHPDQLAIARVADVDPARGAWRDKVARRIRDEVTRTQPDAARDTRALVAFNRDLVARHGLFTCAQESLLARPTDLIADPDGERAREHESAAIRRQVHSWRDRHSAYSDLDAATSYTVDRVVDIGIRKLRATSGYLSAADYLSGDPLLVDPGNPSTAMLFGTGELLPGIHITLLREEILAQVTARHPDHVQRLAWEWLDCSIHGLSVHQDRRTALQLGFTTRAELITAIHTVRAIARDVATRLLLDEGDAGAAS